MPEQVRVHVHPKPLAPRPVSHARLHSPRPQTPARAADEQRRLLLLRHSRPLLEPQPERLRRGAPDRNDTGLLALAEHLHHPILEIQARDIQSHELRQAQARGIQKLHDRPVARGQPAPGGDLQQPRHLVRIEGLRQAPHGLGSGHVMGGIARDPLRAPPPAGGRRCGRALVATSALAQQELVEAAHRGQAALDAARRESRGVRMRGEGAHVLRVERAPVAKARAITELHQRRKIARVARVGVRGQAALGAHVTPESGYPLERRRRHGPLILRRQRAVLLNEAAINSAMRARNSVLMAG